MDQAIRPRAPFTLRNKHTEQECEFHDQSEVDTFRSQSTDAGDWELVSADEPEAAAGAINPPESGDERTGQIEPQAETAPEAPAAAPAVTEEAPAPTEAPTAALKKPRAKK